MPNRYAEDIRRIVGIDDAKKGLPPAADRLLIGASKGIAALTSEGTATISSPGSSTDGTAPAPTTTDPASDKTSSVYQGGDAGILGGNTGGSGTAPGYTTTQGQTSTDDQGRPASFGTGGGGGIRNNAAIKTADQAITSKNAGQFTADELFGNIGPTPGATITDLPKDGYVGNTLLSGGTLKELIATECTTGQEMRIRTDGLYTPPEASYVSELTQDDNTKITNEFIDPDTAVAIPDAYPGEVYGVTHFSPSAPTTYYNYSGDAFTDARAHIETNDPGFPILELPLGAQEMWNAYADGGGGAQAIVFHDTCANLGDPAGVCPIPPLDTESFVWPVSGFYESATRSPKLTNVVEDSFIVSFSAGKFAPHPQDGNVPTNLSQGGTRADFCYDSGTKFGSMQQTRDGGFVAYKTDTEGGAVDSTAPVRVFDADGLPTGFTDAAGLSAILPNSTNY